MKFYATVLLTLTFLLTTNVLSFAEESQIVDMMNEQKEHLGLIIMWAEGYISCATNDLTLDEGWVTELTQTIVNSCAGHSEVRILDIVQEIINE
ncbi:hypothetical protein [Desulfovibrio inopinatus]|uniref:hypothetical protein n=1 Tax=Desulfovibrio inopinatus TaxID=102109 RepID=UPI0003F99A91|nr:hypothetical protein [Desulfovibrio inopinatus]